MRKALNLLFLILCLAIILTSCNSSNSEAIADKENSDSDVAGESTGSNESTEDIEAIELPTVHEYTSKEIEEMKNPNFSQPFSSYTDGDDKYSDDEIKSIISRIPYDKYEVYPHLNNVPLTATLYKGNEVISLDIKDPRLIQIMNLMVQNL